MKGFYHSSELIQVAPRSSLIPKCGECGLKKGCLTPKMKPHGEGRRGVLVVGEAPGAEEDKKGRQFVGDTGQYLRKILRQLDVDLDRDCWTTNSLACRPPKNKIPREEMIDFCRPLVLKAITTYQPDVIILLGGHAVKSVITHVWGANPEGIFRWAGFQIPSHTPNAWICPTFHPSFVTRSLDDARPDPVPAMYFKRHLKQAFSLEGKPWEHPPSWDKDVERYYNDEEATKAIREVGRSRKPVAFDFETDRLKPDSKKASIVCCALSDGIRTVAYPWIGKAITETRKFLQSNTPKIGFNIKFEERWSKVDWLRVNLGVDVCNWVWDGQLAAHCLENRENICSLDFQAFAYLGMPQWDQRVSALLKSKEGGGNTPNKIHDIDLGSLMSYCGLDAFIEWRLAHVQANRLGVVL